MSDQIRAAFPGAESIFLASGEAPALSADFRRKMIQGKRSLLLDVQPGPLLRPLSRPYGQGKPESYLYTETGCPFDCQYCFLQQWLSSPVPTIFVNRETLSDQIDAQVAGQGGRLYLHAGEVSDALAWDPFTRQSDVLIDACRRHPDLTVEMRTKSASVDHLLSKTPPANLVLSWTLAPEQAIVKYEPRTPRLRERIDAMAAASKAGYPVAVRFDPMICHGDYGEAYPELIKILAARLARPPADVSAGSMRMTTPCLKSARSRFMRSRLFSGELVLCSDGKWRYARPIRKRGYARLRDAVRRAWGLELSLCMEPD